MAGISAQRRREILDALRRGTVPKRSLDAFAVGLSSFAPTLSEELSMVSAGGSVFKALRGEYGSGKTFFARWLQELSKEKGFAAAEVQISETETPLHKLETVYRRVIESLSTSSEPEGAFRSIVDGWLYTLEQDVLGARGELSEEELLKATDELLETRLASISKHAPMFSLAMRAYRNFSAKGDRANADGIIAWLGGQPNVAASAKRDAGIKGDIDHFGALSFLRGLLVVLRDSGFSGLMLVLDEVETLQRVRGDVRDKWLNALRQLIDEIDSGRFPGLYLLITGTPAFYDSPQGVQRLAPLAQRLHVEFSPDRKFDNPRAIQVRLSAFSMASLVEVGQKVRDLFAEGSDQSERMLSVVDDRYILDLAERLTSRFGGKVGVVPRIFLKKLVSEILDRVEQFPEFDPRKDYALTVNDAELTEAERASAGAHDINQIRLDL